MKTQSLIVISGPSGVGKSTIINALLQDAALPLADVITCTTRAMREGESEGSPYYFLSEQEFERKIEAGEFLEWARVHKKFLYGMPKQSLVDIWDKGCVPIMDINVDGMKTLRGCYSEALTIFLLPPSPEALKSRIEHRGGMDSKELQSRLDSLEMELSHTDSFDRALVNEDLSETLKELKAEIKKYIDR